MEVYEKINLYLKEKKLTKKEFTKRLLALDVKLRNTGEVPSENTIYAYLNGRIGIKIELIPYIAEVLEVPEQLLFDDSNRTRKIYLKHILKNATTSEKEYIKLHLCEDQASTHNIPKDRLHHIQDLLLYAPDMFLDKLEETLKNYKDLTLKFTKQ